MDQLVKVLLAINKARTVPQRTLNYGPGLGGFMTGKFKADKLVTYIQKVFIDSEILKNCRLVSNL